MTVTLEPVACLREPCQTSDVVVGHQLLSTVTAEHREYDFTTPESSETGNDLLSMSSSPVPLQQKAVLTPKVGDKLDLTIANVAVRRPETHEALVKLYYSGICRSDASFSVGPLPGYPSENHIPGHEGIGKIVEAHDSSLLGRFVGLRYLGSTCGSCPYCLQGLPTSCPAQLNTPKQLPGTFQEYVTVPVDCLILIPDRFAKCASSLPALCGALCSGSAALAAVRAAKLDHQSVVIVSGIGGAIGHFAGMLAKNVFGAKVVGIDLPWKVAKLEETGFSPFADLLLASPTESSEQTPYDFHQSLMEHCAELRGSQSFQRAADALILAASSAAAFERLEDYVCDGGRIICSGVPYGLHLSLSIHDVVERGIHLTGNLMGSHDVCLQVMQYIADGTICPTVTEIELEEVPAHINSLVDCRSLGKIVACISKLDTICEK